MADVVNRTTKQYLQSINTLDYPVIDWIINPDLSAVVGWPSRYWIITGDVITLMDQTERDAVDAQLLQDLILENRTEAVSDVDDTVPLGVEIRALIELSNKRDNYLVNRMVEVQTMVNDLKNAIVNSSGNVQALKDAVALVDTTALATNTRSKPEAVQAYKDDINAGLND